MADNKKDARFLGFFKNLINEIKEDLHLSKGNNADEIIKKIAEKHAKSGEIEYPLENYREEIEKAIEERNRKRKTLEAQKKEEALPKSIEKTWLEISEKKTGSEEISETLEKQPVPKPEKEFPPKPEKKEISALPKIKKTFSGTEKKEKPELKTKKPEKKRHVKKKKRQKAKKKLVLKTEKPEKEKKPVKKRRKKRKKIKRKTEKKSEKYRPKKKKRKKRHKKKKIVVSKTEITKPFQRPEKKKPPVLKPKPKPAVLKQKNAQEKKISKAELEFETARQLKEAASLISELKAATGTKKVFDRVQYVESVEDKMERIKGMTKNLEFEYLKRRITPEEYKKRRFEYLEAMRFLRAQIKARDKALAEGKIKSKEDFVPETGLPGVGGENASMSQLYDMQRQRQIIDRLENIEQKIGSQTMPAEEKQRWAQTLEKIEQINRAVVKNPQTQKEIAEKLDRLHKAVTKQKPSEPEIIVKKPLMHAKPVLKKKEAIPVSSAEKKPAPLKVPAIKTPIDRFVELVREQKESSFESLAKLLGWGIESVERVGLVLEKKGIVDVHYPPIVTKKPFVSFVNELSEEKPEKINGKLLEEYGFVVDFVPANARIFNIQEEHRPVYQLFTPKVGAYTKAFFEELSDSIAEQIPIEISEVTDTKKSRLLKNKFFAIAKQELKKYLTETPEAEINIMAGMLLHSMYGLGKIEMLMGDNQLEEIAINSAKSPVSVYHKEHGWMKTTLNIASEDEILNYSSQIGRKIGREITTLNPILDAHLVSGDRVSATLSPISGFGNTITIRRFARRPWTIVDFIGKNHAMNLEMASLLWLAIQYEMSVLVAGGTASGKTSTLNALMAMVPSYHRTISIEDVREIMLPKYTHWNWVPLTTRNPNPEGKGGVSMLDLMQSSLRMRPDRIILGEIRKKKEAEVLFEAMHTGHSVYSTIHANSSNQVLRRLTEPPISLPPLEIEAIDLILVQYRDRRRNMRRTYELSEIEAGASGQLSINTVFKWDPRNDSWESVNPPTKLFSQINLHTGMTEAEIKKDLENRARILKWMSETKTTNIDSVGQIMKMFYSEKEKVLEAARKKIDPEKLLGEKQ